MKVWLDGAVRDVGSAALSPLDRGFLLGDGLFETILVQQGTPSRLQAHLARLRRGADIIGLAVPAIDVSAAIASISSANQLADGVARLTVTRGPGPRGVLPPEDASITVLISVTPLPVRLPPARCIIAATTRRNEHSPLSGIKSINYLDNIIARQEAAAHGADEAFLLNTTGSLAEATVSNIFIVLAGQIVTPRVADGALPGVMRAEILSLGAEERHLTPPDLERAEEVFLSNSLGLRAVASVDGQTIGRGEYRVMQELAAALGFTSEIESSGRNDLTN